MLGGAGGGAGGGGGGGGASASAGSEGSAAASGSAFAAEELPSPLTRDSAENCDANWMLKSYAALTRRSSACWS
eukprot:7057663-Prymnesium_polylepis.1